MILRKIPSGNSLSRAAGVDQKTISNLLADNTLPNPTTKVIQKIAKALKVEAWMLLVPGFPFEKMTEKPLKTLSPISYNLLEHMEAEPDAIKLMILHAASHALCQLDDKRSHKLKEIHARWFRELNKDT